MFCFNFVLAQDTTAVVKTPVAVKAPIAQDTTAVVKTPVAVKAPVAVEAPVAVKAPVAVEAPVAVKAPVAVEAPVAVKAPAMAPSTGFRVGVNAGMMIGSFGDADEGFTGIPMGATVEIDVQKFLPQAKI